jgi:hypothetical protein
MSNNKFKKLLSLLLAAALVFGFMPGFTQTARAADGGTAENPTIISADIGGQTLNSGYYKLQGTFTNNGRLTVSGDVHLILADDCDATLNGGIQLTGANALTIYGQSAGIGKLKIVMPNQPFRRAGIGGGSAGEIIGTFTMNGGMVTVGAGQYSAAIGNSSDSSGVGGSIIINGGVIEATGNDGAGIGGGHSGPSANITINGGTVTAKGGSGGAGIGGGNRRDGGNITINGGTVTATGGGNAAGIGGGYNGAGGNITINGGAITATKGASSNRGDIGPGGGNGSDGTVTITGGSVKCTSATKIVGTLTNGAGDNVYLATLTLDSAEDNAPLIAAGYGAGGVITANYGVKDVVTRDGGKVYFYLPEATYASGSIAAATAANQYANSADINVNTSNTTEGAWSTGSTPLYTATLNINKELLKNNLQ